MGYGFPEKVYEKAMCYELRELGLAYYRQSPVKVHYKSYDVGEYHADIIVENKVILELKAKALREEHVFQLLNYLKATDIEVGLLLSFGKEPQFIRKIFDNKRKQEHRNRNTDNTD